MNERSRRLQQLVDDLDFEALLSEASVDEIAGAWCRYHELHRTGPPPSVEDDPNWWAVELLFDGSIYRHRDGLTMRELLLALVAQADDDTLGSIGAGPLEDFVSDDPDDLRWLEQECRSNARLRKALAGAWYDNQVADETATRLDRAARTPAPPVS